MRYRILTSIVLLLVANGTFAVPPPSPARWHKPMREYAERDSVAFVAVPYARVRQIRMGMTVAEVGQLVGTRPVDYYIHPKYALLCAERDGRRYEVALLHGSGSTVRAISYRPWQTP